MWSALKDKVLVCISQNNHFYLYYLLGRTGPLIYCCGSFRDFGTPLPAGEPPVDWVEGVAIMAAIFIVVRTFFISVSAPLDSYGPLLGCGRFSK